MHLCHWVVFKDERRTSNIERSTSNEKPGCFLFPSSRLGTQLCRSSSFGEAVSKPELENEGKDHFEILARSLERQRVSAVAGGKLELPSQGVPKLELGNEGKFLVSHSPFDVGRSMFDVHFPFTIRCWTFNVRCSFFPVDTGQKQPSAYGVMGGPCVPMLHTAGIMVGRSDGFRNEHPCAVRPGLHAKAEEGRKFGKAPAENERHGFLRNIQLFLKKPPEMFFIGDEFQNFSG